MEAQADFERLVYVKVRGLIRKCESTQEIIELFTDFIIEANLCDELEIFENKHRKREDLK
jgi:hypothetical protein